MFPLPLQQESQFFPSSCQEAWRLKEYPINNAWFTWGDRKGCCWKLKCSVWLLTFDFLSADMGGNPIQCCSTKSLNPQQIYFADFCSKYSVVLYYIILYCIRAVFWSEIYVICFISGFEEVSLLLLVLLPSTWFLWRHSNYPGACPSKSEVLSQAGF